MTMAKVPAEVRDIEQPWRDAGKAKAKGKAAQLDLLSELP